MFLGDLSTIFDYVRQHYEAKDLSVDFAAPGGNVVYGWPEDEYIDDGYVELLECIYDNWSKYITEPKVQSGGTVRDDTYCVYGVPGSGKSRLLMELRRKIKNENANILSIIITFNDKCNFVPYDTTPVDVWKEIASRIAFSLFGNNTIECFADIDDFVMNDLDNKYFGKKLTWNILVNDIIDYVNKLNKTNYDGIVLLVDEILNTSKNRRDMAKPFLKLFRRGWDDTDLSRKQLSFVFTTLNSYTWIAHESRRIRTFFLPHFGDKVIREQLQGVIGSPLLCFSLSLWCCLFDLLNGWFFVFCFFVVLHVF